MNKCTYNFTVTDVWAQKAVFLTKHVCNILGLSIEPYKALLLPALNGAMVNLIKWCKNCIRNLKATYIMNYVCTNDVIVPNICTMHKLQIYSTPKLRTTCR